MKIKYIKYDKIDFKKWDNCVDSSVSGNISGYSWYLDTLYDEWDALVYDDYEVIMPLPVSKILYVSYIKQSPFALTSGLFYQKLPSSETIDNFIESIPQQIKNINIDIENYSAKNKKIKISEKVLYQLDLISNYNRLYENYSANIKDILSEPEIKKITFQKGTTVNNIIDFILFTENSEKKYIIKIRIFITAILRKRFGEVYTAYDSGNNICAVAVFIGSHYKINMINIFSQNTEFGIKAAISVIDNFIKVNSGKSLTFVFAETENKSINNTYSEFGGSKKVIINLKINKFALYIRLSEKIKEFLRSIF